MYRSLAFCAAAGVTAGALITYAFLPDPTQDVSEPRAVTTFPVTSTAFTDQRTIALRPSFSAQSQVSIGRSGVVTESTCTPGVAFGNGNLIAKIDGHPVVALATSVPFFRDIEPGADGPDVVALRASLRSLGYEIDAEGAFRGGAVDALVDLQKKHGVSRADGVLRTTDFAWIPAAGGAPSTCDVSVGERYVEMSPFATVPGALRSLQVVPSAVAPVPGARSAQVAGVEITLPEDGVIADDESIALIAASPEFTVAADSETIAASTQLLEAREAVSVPAAAIFGLENATGCLQAGDGDVFPIALLSSSLGRALVTFPDEAELPDTVRLSDAITVASCA